MSAKVKNLLLDVVDQIKYDLLGFPFKEVQYPPVKTRLQFNLTNEGVFAISEDVKGLMFSANSLEDLPDALLDAWLVYYDVPRYQAKKSNDRVEIRFADGQVFANREDEALNYA